MSVHRERDVFEACLKREPEARAAFLDEVSAEDPKLAARVRRLLAAHVRAEDLEPVVAEKRASALADPTNIGPYRILERLGEGGMGVVYVAEQTRPIKRRVAIKIIKLGMDTKDVIARFDSERQALALMNHSNIARILDAGATESGRPYFVMEYVNGQSIMTYCDERRLGINERLRLFVDVCEAVEHAHGKGVIHRDLKQSNILVTEENGRPSVKVIDFGIAKATNQRLTELTLFTKLGHVVGTPEYMSPEQAAGNTGEIDTRTDVYSLGVVLYELLIGERPFDFGSSDAGYQEVLRVIREVTPPTPSKRYLALGEAGRHHAVVRSSARTSLVKRLRGDLDWITQKALAKDKEKRYPSANALASDVQRFLDGVPVSAGPPSLISRSGSWVGRHWRIAVAVILLATSVPVLRQFTQRSVPGAGPDGTARVLVLPFEFLGPAEEAYLAEGISEEIRDRLSGLANLTVLGRQTAVYAANRNLNPATIAEELNVDFILDGTVRVQPSESGATAMRIRAGLTATSSLSQLWSDTYAGSADDLFGVQVDVAQRVADAVGIELPVRDRMQLANQSTQDLEAYDFYLRGNEYSRRSELESSMRASLELYEEATRLDPDFAEAWAAASVMRSRLRWRGYDRSEQNLDAARRAGERALALNANAAAGHLALGYYFYYGFRDYESALDHFMPAVDRRPNDPEALLAVGVVTRRQGNWELAVSTLRRALNANPRHSEVAITLGETFLALGDYDQAERHFERAIAITPDRPSGHLFKGWLYLASHGEITPAVDALQTGWREVDGPRIFELFGRYLSEIDWWMTRVLAPDSRFQQMFQSIDLQTISIDTVAYHLHGSQFHHTLGNAARSAAHADSARMALERRGGLSRGGDPGPLSPTAKRQQASRWVHYALALLGTGDSSAAVNAAYESVRFFSPDFDALHGSEIPIQVGLIEASLGMRDSAVMRLTSAFSRPSSFRADMLRHDRDLSWLLSVLPAQNFNATQRIVRRGSP